jgi:hypothetical protein
VTLRSTFLIVALLVSGCDPGQDVPKGLSDLSNELVSEAKGLVDSLGFGNSAPAPVASASPKDLITSAAALKARETGQILAEMFSVVFMQKTSEIDRVLYDSLHGSLNQGASYEGVYNGLTHSSDYRKLEISITGASPGAIQEFCEELARIELELSHATAFDSSSAQPLPRALQPAVMSDSDAPTTEPMPTSSARPSLEQLADQYGKLFVGASIFTLKRVLSDEAIRLIGEKKEIPGRLATWYSKWVVHMVSRGVDFGLPERNRADEDYHLNWAKKNSDDLLTWEVLNRIHRSLNDANLMKQ